VWTKKSRLANLGTLSTTPNCHSIFILEVNGKSYSSLNSQKYGGVEGPGMFAGNEFITPPPNGIPMAGMPQQLQDPSIFANQKLIQQQMQQMQKQQQQQRVGNECDKK
jgi:hypothetical protein